MTAVSLERTRVEDETEFAVDVVRGDFHETVRVRGDLDIATAPILRAALDGVYARRPWRVEIDLSGITFLDASSVATLIAARRRLAAQRAVLVLVRPSPIACRVIRLTGLDRVLEVEPAAAMRRTGPHRSPGRVPVRCGRSTSDAG